MNSISTLERRAKAKKVAKDKCDSCPKTDVSFDCSTCIWHWLMNSVLNGNDLDVDELKPIIGVAS